MDPPTSPIPPSQLSTWPLLSLLDHDLLQLVKMALVFGATGNEAILVTWDDDVYALGANCNGCLGVGDSRASLQPRRVQQLCKKGQCWGIVGGAGVIRGGAGCFGGGAGLQN